MKAFLQGEWLKHPIHPAIVHIPIAAWPSALILDLLAFAGIGGNAVVRAAFYAILLGLLAAFLAIPTGIADWWDIKQERLAWKLGVFHMVLNMTAASLWALSLGLRAGEALELSQPPLLSFVLAAVGTMMVLVAGYLGGRMVFNHGISVARHTKDRWHKIAKADHANLPPSE